MSNVDVRQDERKSPRNSPDSHDPVPGVVDWILGILAAIVGFGLTAASVLVYTQADQEALREIITEQDVQSNGLTQEELITAAEPFTDWLAVGLGVTGLVLVGAAVVFVYRRRQTRHRVSREGGTTATFLPCTVYGAAVSSLVSSVIPGLGALAGGGVGAHLYSGDSSVRLGAATGLVSFAVTLPLLVSIGVGAVAGGAAIDETGGGGLIAGVVIVSGLVGMLFNAGFGALGGYLADRFA